MLWVDLGKKLRLYGGYEPQIGDSGGDPLRAWLGGSPLSVFGTSTVYCLVSPTFPPLNLKRWTVQSEKLFSSHHLGRSL